MLEGGSNCLKYLKRGWNRKEGRGNKDLKKRGEASWVKGWVPKKGGAGTPLRTMHKTCVSSPGAKNALNKIQQDFAFVPINKAT